MSASSSITLLTGFPAPWPAFVSTRIRIGPPPLRRLQPRGEFLGHAGRDAVVGVGRHDSAGGIADAGPTLWYGEYLRRNGNSAAIVGARTPRSSSGRP